MRWRSAQIGARANRFDGSMDGDIERLLQQGYSVVEGHEQIYRDVDTYNRGAADIVERGRASSSAPHYNRCSGTNWHCF